jgi:hypothetical protein
MPLGRSKRTTPTRAMTASAARLKVDRRVTSGRAIPKPAAWQERAFRYYDDVPEIGDGVNFHANACSRIRFFAAVLDEEGQPRPIDPDEDGDALTRSAEATMQLLGEGPAQAAVVAPLAVNLHLAGEAYLQGCIDPESMVESIRVRSVSEVDDVDGRIAVRDEPGATAVPIDPELNPTMNRVWRPHPQFASRPNTPMTRLLGVCEELLLLSQAERAGDRSRLARSGLALFDSSVEIPPTGPDDHRGTAQRLMDLIYGAATSAISEEGSASAAIPVFAECSPGPGQKVADLIHHLPFDRPADASTLERRDKLIRRIGYGLEVPPDVITGMKDVKYCADDRTECLTRRGWLRYDQVQIGDEILTLNHTTGLSEWQPALDVSHFDVVNELMLAMRSQSHSSLTTLDHRWAVVRRRKDGTLVREWTTSADFSAADSIERAAACVNVPSEAKYADEFVELVAWFWTEGHARPVRLTAGGRPRRRWGDLSQSHEQYPENVTRIRRALHALYGPPAVAHASAVPGRPVYRETVGTRGCTKWLLNDEALAPLLAVMDEQKVVDPEFIASLTRSQLELFVTVSVLADGNSRAHSDTIWQKVPARLDAFEMACALLGRPTARGAEQQHLSVSTRRNRVTPWPTRQVETYTGVVWCPTTPNQTWLARRDGTVYFTGNTNAIQIDKSTFRHYVEPFAIVMADAFTVAVLRPGLLADGIDPEVARSVFVWYDPTELVTEPDQAEPAEKVHEAGELSGSALRRFHGISDDDAPTPIERALRFAEKQKLTPEAAQQLIVAIASGQLDPTATETMPLMLPAPTVAGDTAPAAGADTIDGETVQAAAATVSRDQISTRQLVDLDRDVRTRLHSECELAVAGALRRAAANLAGAAQKDTAARGIAATAARGQLAATLGPAVCASLVAPRKVQELTDPTPAVLAAVAADELLKGALEDLRGRARTLLESGQASAAELAASLAAFTGRRPIVPGESRLAGWLDDALAYLIGSLTSLLGARLFDPAEAATSVPLGVARATVGYAAGLPEGHSGYQPSGLPVMIGDGAVSYATGRITTDTFRSVGVEVLEYEWNYGITSMGKRFEPHYELNGLRFTSFSDEALANRDSFPGEPFYVPGDHNGCACDAIPIYDATSGMSGTGDEPNLGQDRPVYVEPIAAGAR